MLLVRLRPDLESVLADLASIFNFTFECKFQRLNDWGRPQKCYRISDKFYARKAHLDDYIHNGTIGTAYDRASVLYRLYACRYLTIGDIEYPTYDDWQEKYGYRCGYKYSLDHCLPIRWFPRLTFDCSNWQPLTIEDNQNKADDFLDAGIERLERLSNELAEIRKKYQD